MDGCKTLAKEREKKKELFQFLSKRLENCQPSGAKYLDDSDEVNPAPETLENSLQLLVMRKNLKKALLRWSCSIRQSWTR